MSINESIDYVTNNVKFFGENFLLERPVYKALTMPGKKLLLIDEIDKATEEIEHTLLETLSDFAMSIPELGTIVCKPEDTPIVILTSNRYRELSAPLKRRCVYLYIRHKSKEEIQQILLMKVSNDNTFCERIAEYLYQISQLDLQHTTSISEGITWAKFPLNSIGVKSDEDIRSSAAYTIGFLAKDNLDRKAILRHVFGERNV